MQSVADPFLVLLLKSPTLFTSFPRSISSSSLDFFLSPHHSQLKDAFSSPCSTVENGLIVEKGTYDQLMDNKGPFFRLQEEHGGNTQKHDEEDEAAEEDAIDQIKGLDIETRKDKLKIRSGAEGTGKLEVRRLPSLASRFFFQLSMLTSILPVFSGSTHEGREEDRRICVEVRRVLFLAARSPSSPRR